MRSRTRVTRWRSRGRIVLLAGLHFLGTALRAHEEWNNLHIVYSAKTEYVYPFDGRSPKIAVALLNHHPTSAPATNFTFSVDGQPQSGGGFGLFPDGGSILIGPDDFGIASAATGGIYDGRAGAAPTVGETKEYTFKFVFALAPGAVAPPGSVTPTNPDPDNNGDIPGTTTAKVRFVNLGDNPTLSGPLALAGSVRLAAGSAGGPPANVTPQVEVSTPYSSWFPLALTSATTVGGTVFSFTQALPGRDDWHLRFSAPGYETRVVAVGRFLDPRPGLDLTLAPAPASDLDYRRIAAVATPTGFWRGAVSESEGTFAAFPGQETWRTTNNDTEARALRAASRIYKYKFDGTKLWEHAPGWETWAGDMSADGRFVTYALNPTVRPFYTPTENKLVLLDGATGAVLWTKAAAPSDAATGRKLDSLELAFSPDARWIAVGSVAGGQVTLVDRATGGFVWSVPGSGPSFGQVRRLRFSPDGQYLYCGSGDSHVRQLRVSDGAVLWKIYAGGWPNVNGLDLTPDGSWLVAGAKSLDATLVRASDGRVEWQNETQHLDAVFAPDGRHVVTAGGQIYRTRDGSLAGMTKTAALPRFTPDGRYLVQFDREPRLYDLGGKPVRTFAGGDPAPANGDQSQWAHLSRDGRYAIVLGRDLLNPPQTGITIYERQSAGAAAAAPRITSAPLAQAIASGGTATLLVEASGNGPLSYQWRKNGTDLPGKNSATLSLSSVSAADAGNYTCVIGNAAGSVTSSPAALDIIAPEVANPSRLSNLAVRVEVGATPLIVGFSIGGSATDGTKTLLIRGAGPALTALGVPGALADPRIALFSGTTNVLDNDNWLGSADVTAMAARLGAFPFGAATSRDAALVATAVRGSYTVQLMSNDASTGTALAEVYDGTAAFAAGTPRLVNLSARTNVSEGAGGVLIAGFVVAGPTARTVLVRGIGPALQAFGVTNALADTQLALFRDTTPVAANDNWYDAPNALAIASATTQVGAFPIGSSSRDAALLLSLPPGSYTAQVRSAAGAAGNALIEVYEVP